MILLLFYYKDYEKVIFSDMRWQVSIESFIGSVF